MAGVVLVLQAKDKVLAWQMCLGRHTHGLHNTRLDRPVCSLRPLHLRLHASSAVPLTTGFFVKVYGSGA